MNSTTTPWEIVSDRNYAKERKPEHEPEDERRQELERAIAERDALLESRAWRWTRTAGRGKSPVSDENGFEPQAREGTRPHTEDTSLAYIHRQLEAIHADSRYKKVRRAQRFLRRLRRKLVQKKFAKPVEKKPQRLKELDLADRRRAARKAVRYLEERLWGGYSREIEPRLLTLCASRDTIEAGEAAWLLSRWYVAHGRYDVALGFLESFASKTAARERKLEVHIVRRLLLSLGARPDYEHLELPSSVARLSLETRPLLKTSHSIASASVLAYLNSVGAAWAPEALAPYNTILEEAGFVSLLAREKNTVALDNLTCSQPANDDGIEQAECVSIICPTYNAEATIATVLEGLKGQTWKNLDIIVADDASTDRTVEIVRSFAKEDVRIRVIEAEVNRGGYANRNRALEFARGEFVTIHDADDWSHAQKIEVQVRALSQSGDPMNFTSWTRVASNMRVIGLSRGGARLVALNHSSGMLRTETVRAAGGWDTTRISADTELFWRILTLEGYESVDLTRFHLYPAVPLAFGRVDPQSLTRTPVTHILTVMHGVRREYLEACAHWHRTLMVGDYPGARQDIESGNAFQVPGFIQSERLSPSEYVFDVLIVCDWNLSGGVYHSALNMLRALTRAKYRCAIFHYCSFDRSLSKPLKDKVRSEAKLRGVRILAPGEMAHASLVLVAYPRILEHPIDLFPTLKFDRLIVLQTQLPERNTTGTDIAYSLESVRGTLQTLFGTEGHWKAISGRVQALMREQDRFPDPGNDIWMEIVDVGEWCAHEVPRRNNSDRRPVIGRHGRDHALKWPQDPCDLARAFCADLPCEVRIMGGADIALQRLGRKPANWSILPFGTKASRDFLAELDFFIHFPDEEYIEEFGRAAMEAMAVGIPVILPPIFEETFGDAAIYANPSRVWSVIEAYWHDEEAWYQQACLGREFVLRHCSYEGFVRRVQGYLPASRSGNQNCE